MFFSREKTPPRFQPANLEQVFPILLNGHILFEALVAATQLGLFEHLDKHPVQRRQEIAQALRLADQPLRALLMVCCSVKLLNRDPSGGYTNHPLASRFLCPSKAESLLPVLEAHHSVVYRPMSHLTESIRQNTNVGLREYEGNEPTLYERLAHHPKLEAVFHGWMKAIGDVSKVSSRFYPCIAPTLADRRHLIDVGGGDGTNAIRLCREFPRLKVSVFDLPTVCERVRQNAAEQGLADRVDAIPGNFVKDPFPAVGADAIYFSHIFSIYSPERNQEFLRKSHAALSPGGSVIIFNSMTRDDETGEVTPAALSLYFIALATGEGMIYPLKDYDAWLAAAGFGKVEKIPLDQGTRAFVIGTRS